MFKPTKYKCLFENCQREVIKFRSTDKCYCAEHRYVVLKQNKKKIVKIKQVSDKRAVQLKEYSKLRKEFLKEHPMCEIYPDKKAVEVHHTYPGANRIKYFLEEDSWMAVSREGHNWIHENVKQSKVLGYLK